jgi:DNA-binding transcriptional MerR regulator
MAMQLPQKRAPESPAIPDRLYFKIGDVARICEVETYVLRFWETQFPQLKPNKSGTGQRLYRRRDVELALRIKRLVHGDGYTLSGARQVLEQGNRHRGPARIAAPETQPMLPLAESDVQERVDGVAAAIDRARAELREIASLLAAPEPQPPRRRARLTTMTPSSGSLFPS